jgi:hypothetical protein
MLSNVRSVGALIRKCAFLLLAFSVFWFGLHARLGAYKSSPPNPTASKISTEKHSAEVLRVLDKQAEPASDVAVLLFGFFLHGLHLQATPRPLGELAKISLSDPRRLDLAGIYCLHGPPSTIL